MAERVIDVSVHQGDIDFSRVKQDGFIGVIIRAGYGRMPDQYDRNFVKNYANAKAAGLKVGAYWYSYSISVADSVTEAETCLGVIGGKEFDYPVFYDVEEGTIGAYSKETVTQMVNAFCARIEQDGYKAGYYCNTNWYNNHLNPQKIAYPLWLADWRSNSVELTAGIKKAFHQYTSDGFVDGVSGRVDLDYCYYNTVSQETNTNTNKLTTSANLNLRQEAFVGSPVLVTIPKGATNLERVTDDGYGWSKIRYNGVVGWCSNKYLSGVSGLSAYHHCSCTGNNVNVRSGAGLNYPVLRQLDKGNEFLMVSVDHNGWYCIEVAGVDGFGYIHKDYVHVD